MTCMHVENVNLISYYTIYNKKKKNYKIETIYLILVLNLTVKFQLYRYLTFSFYLVQVKPFTALYLIKFYISCT